MRISDWSSDVCSSDLRGHLLAKVEFRMADHLVGADGHHAEMEHMQTHAGDTRIVERRCETGDHAVPVHVALLERLMVGRGVGPPLVDVLAKGQPLAPFGIVVMAGRNNSEERRVGKECVITCRSLWSQYP